MGWKYAGAVLACLGGLALPALAAQQQWIELPAQEGANAPARFFPAGYRTDEVEIPLKAAGERGSELEYKVKMKSGEALVYSWEVPGVANPEEFYTEFHGHTEAEPGQPGILMYYRKATGTSESAAFVAPFEGIHGWYLQNQTTGPVTVRLRLAGFYELVE